MSKTIPILLQTKYDQPATTMCGLLRIAPVGGTPFGFSSTNRAVAFNDGDGELTYQANTGYDSSALVSTSDAAVDNAEVRILLMPGLPYGEAEIVAGELDGAEFSVYAVDYEDLAAGARIVAHGYLGKAKIGERGSSVSFELRSLVDYLRQVPWEHYQRTCRVRVFGSQPGDERFPCMYDLTGEWVNDVPVTSVGVEDNRTFTASSLGQAQDYFAPGMWLWTTGPNAGLSFEIAEFDAGGVVTLTFPTPYPISPTDEGDVRRDCTREWDGHNSCDTFANRLWFRGEPKMRPADAMATQIPGAQSGPGAGGESYVPEPEEA